MTGNSPGHPTGVNELLQRATDDLEAPASRLVAGGVTRGRALRRRQRIGTAIAAAAVFGVIGVTAAVIPSVTGDDSSAPDDARFATGPSGPSGPTTAALPKPQTEPEIITVFDAPRPGARDLTVAAVDVPAAVATVVGRDGAGEIRTGMPYPLVDDRYDKIVHFSWQGTLTTVIIEPVGIADAEDCTNVAAEGSPCEVTGSGKLTSYWQQTGDGVTARGLTAWSGDGYRINVISYNAPEGKDVATTFPEPPLTRAELEAVAASDIWFE